MDPCVGSTIKLDLVRSDVARDVKVIFKYLVDSLRRLRDSRGDVAAIFVGVVSGAPKPDWASTGQHWCCSDTRSPDSWGAYFPPVAAMGKF